MSFRRLGIRILASIAAAFLAAGLASSAIAQDVKVFAINTRAPGLQPVKQPLLITYGGALPREQLYVRIFRGRLNDLKRQLPRPGDSCVLYTATQVYPVSVEGGTLRVDGLAEFFGLSHQRLQTFTLVFESGQNNVSNGQLSLWPGEKGVERYFGHAVEWSLDADDIQVAQWKQEEQQVARQQRAAPQPSHSLLGWLLGPSKVYAAVAAPRKPKYRVDDLTVLLTKVESPTPTPKPVHDCQRVTVALSNDPGAEPGSSDQLAELRRGPASCGID